MNKNISKLFTLFSISLLMISFTNIEARKTVWIDSFNSTLNKLPRNWHGRGKTAKKFYKVAKAEKGKNKFLAVKTIDSAQFIGKKVKVDIVKYPYLNWRWRVHILPPGGNESKKPKCDVPASMNVVLDDSRMLGIPKPKTIKYSWSTTLRKGTITTSPYGYWPSQVDIVVLRSGPRKKGKWVWEKRNVLKDYKKFYKKKDVKSFVIDGIVIMSDSDSTHTISAADYDDIYFSSK